MYHSECFEAAKNCETLSLAETASEGLQYSEEELTLLTDKWSRYSFAYVSLTSFYSNQPVTISIFHTYFTLNILLLFSSC